MADKAAANNSLQFYQQCGSLIDDIEKDERELRVVELEIKAIEAENKKLAKEYDQKKRRLSEATREIEFLQMATANQDQAIQSARTNVEVSRQQIVLKEKEIQAEESKRKERRAKYERQLLDLEKEIARRHSIYENMPLVKKIEDLKKMYQNEQSEYEAKEKEIKHLKEQLKGFERLPYKTVNEWAVSLAQSYMKIKSLEKDVGGHLKSISSAKKQLQAIDKEEEEAKKRLTKKNLAGSIGLKSFFQTTKKTPSEFPGTRSFMSKDFGTSGSKVQSKFGSTSNINSSSRSSLLPKSIPPQSSTITKSYSLSSLASFLPKSKFFSSIASAPKGNIQKCYSTSSISPFPKSEVANKSSTDNQPKAQTPKLSTWLTSSASNDATPNNSNAAAIKQSSSTSRNEEHLSANVEKMELDVILEESNAVETMQSEPASMCGLLQTEECGVDKKVEGTLQRTDVVSSQVLSPKVTDSCNDDDDSEQAASPLPTQQRDEGVFQKPWTPKKLNTSLCSPTEQETAPLSPIGSAPDNEYFTPPSGNTSVEYDFVEQYKTGLAEIHKTAISNFNETHHRLATAENHAEVDMSGDVNVEVPNADCIPQQNETTIANSSSNDNSSNKGDEETPVAVEEPSLNNLEDGDVAMDTNDVGSDEKRHNVSIVTNPEGDSNTPNMLSTTNEDDAADVSMDGEGDGNMNFFKNMYNNEEGEDVSVDAANTSTTSGDGGFNFSKLFASAARDSGDVSNEQEEGGGSMDFLQMFGNHNDTSVDAGDESAAGNFNFNFNSNDDSIDQGEFKTPKSPDDTPLSPFNFGNVRSPYSTGEDSNEVPSFFDKMTSNDDDDDDEGASGFKFDMQDDDGDDDGDQSAGGMSSFAKIFGLGS